VQINLGEVRRALHHSLFLDCFVFVHFILSFAYYFVLTCCDLFYFLALFNYDLYFIFLQTTSDNFPN